MILQLGTVPNWLLIGFTFLIVYFFFKMKQMIINPKIRQPRPTRVLCSKWARDQFALSKRPNRAGRFR